MLNREESMLLLVQTPTGSRWEVVSNTFRNTLFQQWRLSALPLPFKLVYATTVLNGTLASSTSSSTTILRSGRSGLKICRFTASPTRTNSLNTRNAKGTVISIRWKIEALNLLRIHVRKNVPNATQGYRESLASMNACSRPPYRTYGCRVSRSL